MNALVTGGRGFIGSFLVEELLRRGFEVNCLLRKKKNGLGWLEGLAFNYIEGDLHNEQSLKEAVKGVDYVFHLAGVTKARNMAEFDRMNADGTRNLLEATVETSPEVRKFVLVSSLAAVGPSTNGEPKTESDPARPISNYGRSKLKAEQIALSFAQKFPVAILRPPAVYGPRDKDMLNIFKYVKQGWLPGLPGGPRYTSLVHVKDLVQGILLAAENEVSIGQVYFMCDSSFYSWTQIENTVADILNKQPRKVPVPLSLAFLFSLGSDLFSRLSGRPTLFNLDKFKELKATHWICKNSKAQSELGFEPRYGLTEGLKETANWYVKEGWV